MKKDFDCVEMKRQGQEQLRRRFAGMSKDEQLAYWARRHEEILERQRRAREARKRPA